MVDIKYNDKTGRVTIDQLGTQIDFRLSDLTYDSRTELINMVADFQCSTSTNNRSY